MSMSFVDSNEIYRSTQLARFNLERYINLKKNLSYENLQRSNGKNRRRLISIGSIQQKQNRQIHSKND